MPTREQVLSEKTHKDDVVELDARVYYTLAQSGTDMRPESKLQLQVHRNTKAIALLVKHLRMKGLLSDDQIDDMLIECVLS